MQRLTPCLYFIEYLLMRVVYSLLGLLPLRLLYAIACGVGLMGYYILPQKREIALKNLRLVFGTEKTERQLHRIARAAMINLVFIYLEFIYFSRRRQQLERYFYFDAAGRKFVDDLTAGRKAAMYITAHLGSWEFLTLCAGFIGQKMHAIGRPIKNRFMFDYISKLRCSTESSVIDKDNAVKGTLKVFQKKEIVGTLVDQRVAKSGILVDFFGHPAYTTPFPALMKIKYDCVLCPVFAVREKLGLFHIIVKDELKVPVYLDSNKEKIKFMVQEYTKVVEDMVRRYPEQWLWYHRRWRL